MEESLSVIVLVQKTPTSKNDDVEGLEDDENSLIVVGIEGLRSQDD